MRDASSATVNPARPAPTMQMSTSRSNVNLACSRNAASCLLASLDEVSIMRLVSYEGLARLSPCPKPELVDLLKTSVPNPRFAPFAATASRTSGSKRTLVTFLSQCGLDSEVLLTDLRPE